MTQDVFADRLKLHDTVARLIAATRAGPASIDSAIETLKDQPHLLADALTDGAIMDAATLEHPAYAPFAAAATATLEQAVMVAKLAQSGKSQLLQDFIAGEWVAFTLNAQGWVDTLLLIHAVADGHIQQGWRTGYGATMTAIWNMVEAEQELTAARSRGYWLRAVAFGDAGAMMDLHGGDYPQDIPRNGALKAEISEQAARVAKHQQAFDKARRGLDTALKPLEVENRPQL